MNGLRTTLSFLAIRVVVYSIVTSGDDIFRDLSVFKNINQLLITYLFEVSISLKRFKISHIMVVMHDMSYKYQ